VIAPIGQTPPPAVVVPPPPGFVQITLQTTVIIGPTPTPLPNVRVVPLDPDATTTPTPASGLVAESPVRARGCQGDPGEIDAKDYRIVYPPASSCRVSPTALLGKSKSPMTSG
jgi:hypothetical protein